MLEFLRRRLAELVEQRGALADALSGTYAEARSANRDLTEAEQAAYDEARGALVKHDEAIADAKRRLAEAEEDEKRAAGVAALAAEFGTEERTQRAPAIVGSEPETYRKDGQFSYFRDLTMVSLNRADSGARARLERNNREVEVETRALSTTDGAGGDFVPPLWMINDYVELARTARPTADRVRNETLPGGTDQVNVPKILTGTAVAEQATQNTAVQNTDATTGSVAANVATLAGQQILPVQLIEQSPLNMDTILLADLAADYAAKVDLFVLNNNAANKMGLLQQTGTNAVTYTSASPTVALLWSKLADAIQQVTTNRFLPPDTIVMHPRRWAYLLAATDSAGRPIIGVDNGPTFNSLGTSTGVASANGVVGRIAGLDVVVDPQVPTNLGAGTNQDPIIVFRSSDSILWEGAPHAEAFRETKADQLSVLLRFYRYAAFTTARYAKSVSVINGTGLVAPTF
ncbi:MAG: phage major capsid protein [Nocardioidaceae bacterium]|nr:phage major capsid protein [Dermatophilaceae bacterium]NUR05853.1 phage major capsid protein [Nocardioidaceae bacterium]NUR80029.1 phage major capsid protein [Dermatophilaceae bacterium]